ncbi:hypothetical protein GW7_17600 [Heterocephalus glaber]|uniref:Uncharacterized protein n=1 Tax=Heterocephalus glaber TaxID=10181 RepID=G5ALU3_HETGA|nr:hypothetical protein GW7_17600 [Heterocephalus glaber]
MKTDEGDSESWTANFPRRGRDVIHKTRPEALESCCRRKGKRKTLLEEISSSGDDGSLRF